MNWTFKNFFRTKDSVKAQDTFEQKLLNVFDSIEQENLNFRVRVEGDPSEQRILQRANEVLGKLLFYSHDKATKAKEKLQLLQDLSHDLRTPLANLQHLIALLGKDLSATDKQQTLETAEGEMDYTLRLVEHLLSLARLEESLDKSTQVSVVENMDLLTLMSEVVELQRKREPNSKLGIELKNLLSGRQRVLGRRLLVERLLKNLIENATSFAKSQVLVTLKEQGPLVEVSIADDGPGMPVEEISKFGSKRPSRIFHSTQNSTQRLSLGLGSVIARKICQRENIELIVESQHSTKHIASGTVIRLRFAATTAKT